MTRHMDSATRNLGHLGYLTLQSTKEGQAAHAHVHEISRGLRSAGWSVVVFEPKHGGDPSQPLPLLRRLWSLVALQVRVWRRLTSLDALYVRWHFAALPTCLVARLKHIPIMMEVNGTYEDALLAWPQLARLKGPIELAGRCTLQLAQWVVVVTEQLGEWVRTEGVRRPVSVIPNGANTSLFEPGLERLPHLPERYALFFGALAPWQGIDTLLEATHQIEWPDDVSLVVAGDGPEQDRVRDAADGQRVVLLGEIKYGDMPRVVAPALVALSPQSARTKRASTGVLPLKVYEAMSSGVPVVVSDLPGQRELVTQSECGIVVPPDDPMGLAAAVAYLASHEIDRQGMGALGRRAMIHHSWSARARQTDLILRRMLDRKRS